MNFTTILFLLIWGIVVIWVGYRILLLSDDPWRWLKLAGVAMAFGLVAIVVGFSGWAGSSSPAVRFGALSVVVICCLFVSIYLVPVIGRLVAMPLTGQFDGGTYELEARPLFDVALAKMKRGQYEEAVKEVRLQLEQFPDDTEGTVLLVDLLSKYLNRIEEAERAVEDFLEQGPHVPAKTFRVLSHLAELHTGKYSAPEKARACWERIQALCPGTQEETIAYQRLAHLGSAEFHEAKKVPVRFRVQKSDRRLGLLEGPADISQNVPSPAEQFQACQQQLRDHPRDGETREKLALLYAEHYGMLEEAVEQLEFMVRAPNQPRRQIVHWLNLMVDLHVKFGDNVSEAREILKRISQEFPGTAYDFQARKRIHYLGLEMRRSGK